MKSRVVSAKRTILSPFTKEYRAEAIIIGISPKTMKKVFCLEVEVCGHWLE